VDAAPDDAGTDNDADLANARFFRALGDPTRLAIIRYLLTRPHSVAELIVKLDAPQSRVSNHLACLRWCGFVAAERHGREVIYSIGDRRLRRLLRLATEMVDDNDELGPVATQADADRQRTRDTRATDMG
jgi:DNA-binding transcriptional ArsR family regulator